MAETQGLHESFDRASDVKTGSERAFGLVFAAVFLLVALWPLLAGDAPRYWAIVVALVFAAAAGLAPRILEPLNRLWFRFGMLLHRIVSPLIMALLFFLTVTPIALVIRFMGKDPSASNSTVPRAPIGSNVRRRGPRPSPCAINFDGVYGCPFSPSCGCS